LKCKLVEIEIREGEWVYTESLGDLHIGNAGFDEERFLTRRDYIRKTKQKRFWIGMGDYIENIRPYARGAIDRRWDTEILRGEADWDEQIRRFVKMVYPIRRKCLGLLWGNHEWKTMTAKEFEDRVCRPLGVDFLGSRAFVILRLKCKREIVGEYAIFAIHGSYAGHRLGGAFNRLQDLARIYDADIYLMGHTHAKGFQPDIRVSVEFDEDGNNVVVKRPVIYGLTGCFLDPFCLEVDGYMDRRPTPRSVRLGTITIGIDPWEGKLHGYD